MNGQQLGSRSRRSVDAGWRDQANCRLANPDLFFPPDSNEVPDEDVQAAKILCDACQVRDACLQFALETKQEAGIWGGTTETERRRLRRAWLADRRRSSG